MSHILVGALVLYLGLVEAQTCSITTSSSTIANSPTPSYVTQFLFFNSRLYYAIGDSAGYIRYVDYPSIPVSGPVTLAGNGGSSFSPASPGSSAAIPFAHMLVLSADGTTLYSSCANFYVMFSAAVSDGTVSRLVGTGTGGSNDHATGTSATMSNTYGMILDPTDTNQLYFSDLVYHVIRRVTLSGTNPVTTIIGASGSSTFQAGFGTSARIGNPAAMSRFNNDVIYIASVNGYIISWTLATTYVSQLNTPVSQALGEMSTVGSSRAFSAGLWFSFLSTAFVFGEDNYLYISDLGGSNLKVFVADVVNGQLYYTHDNGGLNGRALQVDPDGQLVVNYDNNGFRVLSTTKTESCPLLVTRTPTNQLTESNQVRTLSAEMTSTKQDESSSSSQFSESGSSENLSSSSIQSSSESGSSGTKGMSSSSASTLSSAVGSSGRSKTSSSSSSTDTSDAQISTRRGTIDVEDCSGDDVWWIVLLVVVILVVLVVIIYVLCCADDGEHKTIRSVNAMDQTGESYGNTLSFTSRYESVGSARCFGAPYDNEPAPLRRVASAHCILKEDQDPPAQCLPTRTVTVREECVFVPMELAATPSECEENRLEEDEDALVSSYKSSSYNYESDPTHLSRIDIQVLHGPQDDQCPATPYGGNDDDAVSVTSSQANSPYGRRSGEEKVEPEDPRSPELEDRLSDATSVHSSLDGENNVAMLDLDATKVFAAEQDASPETARIRIFDDEELPEVAQCEDERLPWIEDRLSEALGEDEDELPAIISSKEPAPMPFPSPESARMRAFDDEEILESALSEADRCSDIIDTLSRAEVQLQEGVTTTPREPIHTEEVPTRDPAIDEERKLPIVIPHQPKVDLQLVPKAFSLVPRVSEGAIIELRNTSNEFRVMYSVRSTHSKRYTVRPRHGVIPPSDVEYVSIQLQRHQQQPLPTSGEDRFQVLFRGLWTEEQCPSQRPEITDCLKHAVFEVEGIEYSINTTTDKKQLSCTIQDVKLHNPESETPLMHLL